MLACSVLTESLLARIKLTKDSHSLSHHFFFCDGRRFKFFSFDDVSSLLVFFQLPVLLIDVAIASEYYICHCFFLRMFVSHHNAWLVSNYQFIRLEFGNPLLIYFPPPLEIQNYAWQSCSYTPFIASWFCHKH